MSKQDFNNGMTPGPWSVEENVTAGDINHLAVTNRANGKEWMVCSLTPMRLARGVDYSNGRAIAALPELLQALLDCITDEGSNGMSEGLGRQKRRLLAINIIAANALEKAGVRR